MEDATKVISYIFISSHLFKKYTLTKTQLSKKEKIFTENRTQIFTNINLIKNVGKFQRQNANVKKRSKKALKYRRIKLIKKVFSL